MPDMIGFSPRSSDPPPRWFVVEVTSIGRVGKILVDPAPDVLKDKRLAVKVRLDDREDARRWAAASIADLVAAFDK